MIFKCNGAKGASGIGFDLRRIKMKQDEKRVLLSEDSFSFVLCGNGFLSVRPLLCLEIFESSLFQEND